MALINTAACTTMYREVDTDSSQEGGYLFAGVLYVKCTEFTRVIFSRSEPFSQVLIIPTSAYSTQARRLVHSLLACTDIFRKISTLSPDWRAVLDRVQREIFV